MLLETGCLFMAAAKLVCSGPNEIIEEAAKGLAGKLMKVMEKIFLSSSAPKNRNQRK
jgi:hypothetical protein